MSLMSMKVGACQEGDTIQWAVRSTTLGNIMVAATAQGVCYLSFLPSECPPPSVLADSPPPELQLHSRFPRAHLTKGREDDETEIGKYR